MKKIEFARDAKHNAEERAIYIDREDKNVYIE